MWARISVNSSNIEANMAQIIYPLRVSLLRISSRSKISYISELATAVFTLVLIVLPNHSIGLTCLASVLVLVNVSISVAAMEGFSATNSAAIAPSKGLWNNGPHTQSKKAPQKSLRLNLSN